jgi:hypothetical protein
MSFNGTGIFQINTPGQPVVAGTTITSTAFNALTTDLATGLTNCLTKDGQSTPTANIKMGSYKLTGLGVATTAGDALSFGNNATIATLVLTTALGAAYGGTGLTAPGTAGNVLTSNGAGGWTSSPASLTTFSGGTTGFTPNTPTSGAVVLAGTLAATNGGTGQATLGAARGAFGSGVSNRITANTTAVAGDVLACDTIAVGAFTVTLPASPVAGDAPIKIYDAGTTTTVNGFATNNLTIARNGNTICTLAEDVTVSTKGVTIICEFVNGTWRLYNG